MAKGELPTQARENMNGQAAERLPDDVFEPDIDIIRDNPIVSRESLIGANGETDYFVFDLSYERNNAIIENFEDGVDKIVLINTGDTRFSPVYGPVGDIDFDGLDDQGIFIRPTIPGTRGSTASVSVIDGAGKLDSSDILFYANDPFFLI